MLTRKGRTKRVNLSEFVSVRPSGLIALNLDADDELGWVKLTTGDDEVIIASRDGQSIRFKETDVRAMGRAAAGVGAIRLKGDDEIRGMDIIVPDATLLVVTEKGYAKRTALDEYTLQKRNGGGIRTLTKNITQTGPIIAARVVTGKGDITLISRDGIMLRTAIKDISQLGRATKGVRVMNLKGSDVVASAAVLAPKEKIVDTEDANKSDVEPASTNGKTQPAE
jgi:DNA gyrase subunit A